MFNFLRRKKEIKEKQQKIIKLLEECELDYKKLMADERIYYNTCIRESRSLGIPFDNCNNNHINELKKIYTSHRQCKRLAKEGMNKLNYVARPKEFQKIIKENKKKKVIKK